MEFEVGHDGQIGNIIINNTITVAGRTHSRLLDSADASTIAAGESISLAIALG